MTDGIGAAPTSTRDPDEILAPLESWGVRLELDRVEGLLDSFGKPQNSYATVLVAGTNGKGSTASLLASMVASAGYRTGLFTSPHLEGVEERLRLNGVAVERDELASVLAEVIGQAERRGLEPPTYFEALTVAACLWFSRSKVELAVVEVGMGGRLDATNTCEPVLSLVSEIGLDHTKPLGGTLREIAREKAGIFRSGVPAVVGAGEEEARRELERHAREIGARFEHVSDLFQRVESEEMASAQLVRVESPVSSYALELGLPGEHQVRNLLLALAAAERLAGDGWSELDRSAIERGVKRCSWPGRLERISVPGGGTLWLDVAHNPQGAEVLARFLATHVPNHDLLLGVLEDKDARGVLSALAPGAGRLTLTRPPGPRGLDPETLADWLRDRTGVEVEPDPGKALDRALGRALDPALQERNPLVVCGSLYLVGWIRSALRERFGVPAPATDLAVGPSDQSA
jgi:dihydrofolate synthase/folylpolyglutamate synthase